MKSSLLLLFLAALLASSGCSKSQQTQEVHAANTPQVPTITDSPKKEVMVPRPSVDRVNAAVVEGLPGFVSVSCSEHAYTEMKEFMGTTLPAGSWLIGVKVQLTLKEPLYLRFAPLVQPIPEGARSGDRPVLEEMKKLTNWVSTNPFDHKMRPRTAVRPCAFQVAAAGDEREGWIKVGAEPRGSDWSIKVLEGDAQLTFGKGLPKSKLDSSLPVLGATEQSENLDRVRSEYSEWTRREEVLARIQPEIDQIRASEPQLATQIYVDAQERLLVLESEFKSKFAELESLKDQLFRTMSNDSRQWAERDRLILEATQKFEQWRASWEPKRKACESEMYGSQEKAASETKRLIVQVYTREGIEP